VPACDAISTSTIITTTRKAELSQERDRESLTLGCCSGYVVAVALTPTLPPTPPPHHHHHRHHYQRNGRQHEMHHEATSRVCEPVKPRASEPASREVRSTRTRPPVSFTLSRALSLTPNEPTLVEASRVLRDHTKSKSTHAYTPHVARGSSSDACVDRRGEAAAAAGGGERREEKQCVVWRGGDERQRTTLEAPTPP